MSFQCIVPSILFIVIMVITGGGPGTWLLMAGEPQSYLNEHYNKWHHVQIENNHQTPSLWIAYKEDTIHLSQNWEIVLVASQKTDDTQYELFLRPHLFLPELYVQSFSPLPSVSKKANVQGYHVVLQPLQSGTITLSDALAYFTAIDLPARQHSFSLCSVSVQVEPLSASSQTPHSPPSPDIMRPSTPVFYQRPIFYVFFVTITGLIGTVIIFLYCKQKGTHSSLPEYPLTTLSEISRERLFEVDNRLFYTKLIQAIKQFLYQTHSINLQIMTIEEIIKNNHLTIPLREEDKKFIIKLLSRAQTMKYAPVSVPQGDEESLLYRLEKIIRYYSREFQGRVHR